MNFIKTRVRVLIADDSMINREILKDMLCDEYDIYEAKDGYETVRILEKEKNEIDLLLLDVHMPGLNGFEILEMIHDKEWTDLPVLMISAEVTQSFIHKAYALGAIDYITRPFDFEVVRHKIQITLELYQKQKQAAYELMLANQRHLDALMHSRKECISFYRLNLSQNICVYGKSRYLKEEDKKISAQDAMDLLREQIVNPKDYIRFHKIFSISNLRDEFWNGKSEVHCEHYSRIDDEEIYFSTRMSMFQNPVSKEIEGILYQRDITEEYISRKLPELLYENEYQSVALLDLKHDTITLRKSSIVSEDTEYKNKYSFVCQKICEYMILPEDVEEYLSNAKPENILKELDEKGEFDFVVHHVEEGGSSLKRYRYLYFDKERQIVLSTVEDVTDISETDTVTGGYNRKGFVKKVGSILAASKEEEKFILLYFDIRDFKAINDIFGIKAGDTCLKDYWEKLNKSVMKPLVTSRVESDHFVCLITEEAFQYEHLQKLLQRKFIKNGKAIHIYIKCGIYHIEDKNMSVAGMCDRAKLACGRITNEGAQPYIIFDNKMREQYLDRSEVVNSFQQAIDNKEFKVYYQPIYDAKTGKIVSAEALIRWIHPLRGVISPGAFVPILEESGYISKIDMLVIKEVKRLMLSRKKENKQVFPISVNLSRMDFYDTDILDYILNSAKTDDTLRGYKGIEITESAYKNIDDNVEGFLRELRELSTKIILDDFGSGFSSFSTMTDYDFDVIKLDMGFVRKIGINKKTESVIRSIINMSHDLGIKLTAEGVETKEQLDFLRKNHCDYIQGYYYSKPLAESDFVSLLESAC